MAGVASPRWGGRRLRCIAFALAALLPATALATDPPAVPELPTDPVLASLIEQSLAARPELAQASASARAERERVRQAGALPDPMLELGVQNDGFTSWEIGKMETSWYSIMATQTFPWPGKLGLRSEVAALGADRAAQDVARLRLSTEADVRRAYLALVLARDRLSLLDRLEAISRRAAAIAQARYESGTSGVQSDLLRAQLEVKRVQQRRWALRVQADTALQTLNRLRSHPLGEPIAPPVRLAELPLPTPQSVEAAYADARARSPELAAARAGTSQEQRALKLARKSYLPDFTVNLGVMPRGGDFPPMWLATVGLPLPVFAGSKQSRLVAESEALLTARQSEVQALEQILRLRVEQRWTALSATLETVRIYREGLLAQSEATAESTLAQYEVGNVTFIAVLEANAGFIADQDGFLQVLAQAQTLQIGAAEVSLDPIGLPEAGMDGPASPSGAMQTGGPPMPRPGTSAPPQMESGSSSATGM